MSTRKRTLPSKYDDPNPHKKQRHDTNTSIESSQRSSVHNHTQHNQVPYQLPSSSNDKPFNHENYRDDDSSDESNDSNDQEQDDKQDDEQDGNSIFDNAPIISSQHKVSNTASTIIPPQTRKFSNSMRNTQISTPISRQQTGQQIRYTQNIAFPSSQMRNTKNTGNNYPKKSQHHLHSERSTETERARNGQTQTQNNKKKENKYFLLCVIVGVVLMAICISWFFGEFSNTKFCDNNLEPNTINSLQCKKCPFNAQCNDGKAKCSQNYVLDKYEIICLPLDDQNKYEYTTNIAYTANFVLVQRYKEYLCNKQDKSIIFELSEQQLTDIIFDELYNPLEPIELSLFDESWEYAKTKIIPLVYNETIQFNQKTLKYKTLTVPSLACS